MKMIYFKPSKNTVILTYRNTQIQLKPYCFDFYIIAQVNVLFYIEQIFLCIQRSAAEPADRTSNYNHYPFGFLTLQSS